MATAPKVKVRIELNDRLSLPLAVHAYCFAAMANATPENRVRVNHHVLDLLRVVGEFEAVRAKVDALRTGAKA